MQCSKQQSRTSPAYLLAFIWRASPDVSFNGVQFANTIDSFSGKRGGMRLLNIEELTAHVSPACGFLHAAIGVQRVEPCIRIGLQRTFELCQMLVRMLARAVRCIREPNSRRYHLPCWTVIPHIRPQPSRPGSAFTWFQHGHRGIVGVQLAATDHMLYLVMEYVNGTAIDVYTSGFGIRQTVALF